MKTCIQICSSTLLLLLGSQLALNAQNFKLHSNGVTVVCTNASVDDTGTINGVTYTKRRTKWKITEANAATTCTSSITDMHQMFYFASAFNGDISSWDVSKVTTMNRMFLGADAFNANLSSWDVSNVTDMGYMFSSAKAFNQDLSSWCVSKITSAPSGFGNTSGTNPTWGKCPPRAPTDLTANRRR